ncbi:MAG: hypothetical protein AB4911_08125 [Oscillochloridaceae bacterium umkhey_bin13]
MLIPTGGQLPGRDLLTSLAVLCGAMLLLWLVLRAAPPLLLDVGAPGDARFLSGFYLREEQGERQFRWSGPEARLVLHGANGGPHRLRLRLNGEQLALQPDPSLQLGSDQIPLVRFEVVDGWRDYQVLLPPGSLMHWSGAVRPLDLRSALTQPGQTSNDLDLRQLGVPLAEIELRALPPPHTPALLRAIWLGWLLAVLGGAAAWLGAYLRSTGLISNRWLRPNWLANGTILCGAAGLILWAWYDPTSLAWALPPMPWILGTASLLLLVLGRAIPQAVDSPQPSPSALSPQPSQGPQPSEASVLVGLALLGLAGGLLATQQPWLVGSGAGLGLIALLLLSWGPTGLGHKLWHPPTSDLSQRQALGILGLILVLALGLRLFRLDELPFGLWRDEARHGWFAQLIRDFPDYRPIYLASNRVNMPALGIYPFAVALWLWGEQLWAMRLMASLAGALTVLPLYGLATLLSGRRSLGLLAAFLLATSSWHIAVGRLAFPTIFDPLLTLSGLTLVFLAFQPLGPHANRPLSLRMLAGSGAGVCLGLAVQTYHTGRVAPLVAAWLALLLLGQHWRAWRNWLVVGGVTLLTFLLTLGPLLSYALQQPAAFNDRVNAVFLLSPEVLRAQAPLSALDDALGLHLLMFHVTGDLNGRHHVPGRPMLDYLTGLGLVLGLAGLLRRPLAWQTLFLFGAIGVSLLPSALAMNAPHGLRAIGALAFVCIIAALGWAALWQQVRQHLPSVRSALAQRAAGALLAMVVVLNSLVYFVIMPPQREAFLVFYPVQSQMGVYLRDLNNRQALPPQVFVPAGLPDDPVFAFLASKLPIATFMHDQLSEPAQSGAIFLLSGYFADEERAGLTQALGSEPLLVAEGPLFPDGSRRTFYVYHLP